MAGMPIYNFQRTAHSLVSSIYYRAHHGWAWNTSQNRRSPDGWKTMLNMVFTNNRAKMIQHIAFAAVFEVLVHFLDFPVAVLCFRLPIFSNTKCDYSEVRKYGTFLATSVFKVTAE